MQRTNVSQSQWMNEPNPRPAYPSPPSFKEVFWRGGIISIIGTVMFFVGVYILFWNEGMAVYKARVLDEGLSAVVSLHNNDVIMKENEGKLVHIIGHLSVDEPLEEYDYNIAIRAVKLKRRVQMYQWVEEELTREVEEAGHTREETSYSYSQEWRDKLVDSFSFATPFGHDNPKEIPMKSTVHISEDVRVGAYHLSSKVKETLFTKFTPFTGDDRPERSDIKMHAGIYYHCTDVWDPQIGDIRVQFSYAGLAGKHAELSIIGLQRGNEIGLYQTSSGADLFIVHEGRWNPQDMIATEHSQNRRLNWLLRLAGFVVMFLGLSCLHEALYVLVCQHRVMRELFLLQGRSLNVSVSITVSLVVIALAWLWFRPLLALFLIAVAASPFVYNGYHIFTQSRDSRYRRF